MSSVDLACRATLTSSSDKISPSFQQHMSRGGEVIVSEAVAKDAETGAALTDRMQIDETATLRGVSAPVRFVQVKGFPQCEAAGRFEMRYIATVAVG
jgi:hypothetical protein